MFSLTKAQPRYASAQHAALEEKSETLQLCLCARVTKRLIKKNIFLPFPVSFHVHEIGALQAITSAVNCSFE